MNDERDRTTDIDPEPAPEPEATPVDAEATRRPMTSDDFLVPGPSAESNSGLRQWGCTWLAFSIILMLLMLGISFVCLTLANWTGFA